MVDQTELQALCELSPEVLLRRGPGRETFRWCGAIAEAYIVKRFTRARRLASFGRRPARDEFEALRRLHEAGLRVPEPIELFESAQVALVVMEEVQHSTDLRRRLAEHPEEAAMWSPEVLALTLGLHTRGWYHRDLYLDHFVLELGETGESIALLDLGRARQESRPRRRWFVKDLAALLHSTPSTVSAVTCLRFLRDYLEGRGIVGRRKRRWWRDSVVRKAQRMAAHTPRGGTSFPHDVEGGLEVTR